MFGCQPCTSYLMQTKLGSLSSNNKRYCCTQRRRSNSMFNAICIWWYQFKL